MSWHGVARAKLAIGAWRDCIITKGKSGYQGLEHGKHCFSMEEISRVDYS
jgi:hypothetical protein